MIPRQPAELRVQRDAPAYRRPSRLLRWGGIALGAGGALGVACGGSDTKTAPSIQASDWVESDGGAGRINLDDVREAYQDAYSSKDGLQYEKFAEAVNKIYEGDNLVVIKVAREGDNALISGWEDLNKNETVDTDSDDQLFSITQKLEESGSYEMRGHGSNGYYSGGGFLNGFLPGLLIGQMFAGGRTTYIGAPGYYGNLGTSRGSYRNSPDFNNQQQRNAAYGASAAGRYGSAVNAQPVSPARQSYQQRQINSGGFRSSTSTSRSISSGSRGGSTSGSGGSRSSGAPSGSSGGNTSGGGVSGGGGMMRF